MLGSSPQFNMIIRLWFETVGLAVRGKEPYAEQATAIAINWTNWIQTRLEDPQVGQATAIFAELEGRLMLTLLGITVN
jgi:hypothetical protein